MTLNMSSPAAEMTASCQFLPCLEEDLPEILGPARRLLEKFQQDTALDLSILETALWQKTLAELPDYTKLVRGDTLLGWFHLIQTQDALELDDVNILEPYRSLGLGSILLEQVKRTADQAHCPVRALVKKENDGALRFYSRHGFSPLPSPDPLTHLLEYRGSAF